MAVPVVVWGLLMRVWGRYQGRAGFRGGVGAVGRWLKVTMVHHQGALRLIGCALMDLGVNWRSFRFICSTGLGELPAELDLGTESLGAKGRRRITIMTDLHWI